MILRVKKLDTLNWNCLGSQLLDLSTMSFDLSCSFFNSHKKSNFFFEKRGLTDYNPENFWNLTVQDWTKTSLANDFRPLRTLNGFEVFSS